MLVGGKHYKTVWLDGNIVKMINQPLLPHKFELYNCRDHKETANAISQMVIRGAGAIGAAAGYAMAQAAIEADDGDFYTYIDTAKDVIKNTRPTAQNLFYSVNRVYKVIKNAKSIPYAREEAIREAESIALEDALACKKIGEYGMRLIKDGYKILTHCNAGWLAFVDWGSALSPVYASKRKGINTFVWVDETRPRCQGARLTAWELRQENIDFAVIVDNAAGYYIRKGEVDIIIVGSDRIASNGDIANKIGTYEKAVVAKENGIPFYVAAPTSTIDWDCLSGDKIPIEERSSEEVLSITGMEQSGSILKVSITPSGVKACNPAFDITPAKYLNGIITEKGIIKPEELAHISSG